MNIDYLLEYAVFAEYLNFTKAASALYMTQSALSKHMAALERELGCELIKRDGDAVELTKMGSALLEDVVHVKYAYDKLTAHVTALKSATPMSLKLMVFDTYRVMNDVVAIACRDLNQENPLFDITKLVVKRRSPLQDVREGRADLCFTTLAPGTPSDDLGMVRLYDEPIYAVVRNTHRLAGRGTVSIHDLNGEFWRYPVSAAFSDSYGHIRSLVKSHGVTLRDYPEPWMTTGEFFNYSFTNGVFLGSACAIMQDSPVPARLDYSILRLEESDIKVSCNLIWLKDNANPAVPVFVEAIESVMRRVDVTRYWE